jgi:geranylgeranyl diphosphate synthase type I
LLVCDASGGDWKQAVPGAAAIELLHNFSLIHDDIEDDSDTRRGRETVWKLWGIPQAINAGDSMFAFAFKALSRLENLNVSPTAITHALKVFTNACIHLTKGQHLDMLYENIDDVSLEQYLYMISDKTASLISTTARIGAIVSGASQEKQGHYATFGKNLGLAFQVYDDYLGIWGNEIMLGKSTSTDLLTRKKTLPILFGLENSADLRKLFTQPSIDIDRAVEILDRVGAKEYTREKAQFYSEKALSMLDKAEPQGSAGEALHILTDQLIRREN